MKKILLVLLSLLFIMSCSLDSKPKDESNNETPDNPVVVDPDTPEIPETPENPGSVVTLSRGEVLDANNQFIGYLLDAYPAGISLLTKQGYMFNINWKGEIEDDYMYYSEANGEGIAYSDDCGEAPYAKTVTFANNKYYTFRDSEHGIALPDNTLGDPKSEYSKWNGEIENIGSFYDGLGTCFAFKELQRSDLDYPETIALPITLKFE